MTFAQAILLAILQGVSELFPVSSLGHAVLVPALLRWSIDRASPTFLAFIVVLHLGTAVALLIYYRREWYAIIRAMIGSIVRGKLSGEPSEHLGWLLVVGSVPVGILGVFLERAMRALLGAPITVAIFLTCNGFIMFLGEHLRNRQLAGGRTYKTLDEIGWREAVFVGFSQALALFPGISRSGSSIVAGLLVDLNHLQAARFAFLLATPIIGAAGLLEIPELFAPGVELTLVESIVGGILAAITAYLSVAFLERYFKTNDLRPFGWYSLAAGVACIVIFSTGVLK